MNEKCSERPSNAYISTVKTKFQFEAAIQELVGGGGGLTQPPPPLGQGVGQKQLGLERV